MLWIITHGLFLISTWLQYDTFQSFESDVSANVAGDPNAAEGPDGLFWVGVKADEVGSGEGHLFQWIGNGTNTKLDQVTALSRTWIRFHTSW